jgi:hypothetical protein
MWRLGSVLSLRAVHGCCRGEVFACDNSQQASSGWYVVVKWRVLEQAGSGDVMAAATTLHVTTGAVLGVALPAASSVSVQRPIGWTSPHVLVSFHIDVNCPPVSVLRAAQLPASSTPPGN